MRLIALALSLLVIVVLALGVGSRRQSAEAGISKQDSVTVQGVERSFTVVVPERSDSAGRHPIVMVLHGGEGDASRMMERTRFDDYVDSEGYIAVFPNAGGRQWNDGRETTRSNEDDVAFLRAVVAKVVAAYNGDPARVFVAGGSNGGMMAQRLACEASDLVTAAAVVIANMPADLAERCNPSRPIPMVFLNGTSDPIMPPEGGDVRAAGGKGAGGRVVSTAETIRFWADVAGCRNDAVTDLPDKVEDGTRVRLHQYQGCRKEVASYEIVGGGHSWPGSEPPARPMVRRIIGNTSQDVDATLAIIEFFKPYGL